MRGDTAGREGQGRGIERMIFARIKKTAVFTGRKLKVKPRTRPGQATRTSRAS